MLDCSVYILAGGESSRMQHDKASLSWGKASLLASAIATYQQLSLPVFVLSGNPAHESPTWTCIPDVYPFCGPVGAIDAALHHAQTQYVLFCPVDMPFIHPDGLHSLLSVKASATAFAFSMHGKPKLFPLRLATMLARPWREKLLNGDRKLQQFLDTFQPNFAPANEVIEKHPRFFDNLNTPEDYQEALLWQKNQST